MATTPFGEWLLFRHPVVGALAWGAAFGGFMVVVVTVLGNWSTGSAVLTWIPAGLVGGAAFVLWLRWLRQQGRLPPPPE